jgi:hypothetical protein
VDTGFVGNLKRRDHFKGIGVNGRITTTKIIIIRFNSFFILMC